MRDCIFSVVIPVYNRAHIIRDALASVQMQDFEAYECLIIDDGSSDGDRVKEIVEKEFDHRFKYFRFPNGGASEARNRGIELANGEFIAFLDSDDRFMPNKLSVIERNITENVADIYFSQAKVVRGEGASAVRPSRAPLPNEPLDEYLFCALQPIQTTTIVVRSAAAKSSPFSPGLKKYEEAIFLLRLIAAGHRIHFIPEVLTIWNDHVPTGRLGSRREPTNMTEWLSNNHSLLSSRAQAGFKANVLSYEFGLAKLTQTVKYIAQGYQSGAITGRRATHSLLRALIPQAYYRPMVNRLLLHRRQNDQS